MVDSFQCRPCRKTYSASEVQGRRSCPVCKGPLISQQQLENYRAATQASLDRLKNQSALTLAGGALLAMAVQIGIDLYEHDSDFRALTWLVFAGSIASLVAAGLWWKTGKRPMMLAASAVFQASAMVYAFSVFASMGPLLEQLGDSRRITTGFLILAFSPLGLSLLAWHQYRSYLKVLKA
ncbi:hypothetical protein DES53_101184 [Roseimicrobium gellanilyticum]|uniref:Uncharacterized protein n=1 Tax=Roseimicrobium gellanilyticum TaxID=748857 RepID=A0A366HTH5_9BACT|nr:hypothetical protein [Roseimicrobium gellanilyticum]RBP47387.1 hypothetical protein DES53_101184 [Roseimicrobium gellanilyticum]